jgi:glycosyltransferase involved in cell wall biosynthesis
MSEKQRSFGARRGHRPIRVLLIANTSWYLWNFRRRLAEHLKAAGYEVAFAAPCDAYSRRLAALGRFIPLALDRKGRNPLVEVCTLFRLGSMVRCARPDWVLTWTPKPNIYGALCARLLGVPIIPNIAGLGFAFIGGGMLARLVGALYRLALRPCDVVLFQNAHDRDQFVSAGWTRGRAAWLVPGSGVDLERFRPQARQPGADGDFVFLFVGRLLADKGVRELIEATRRLRRDGSRLRLRLAGFMDPGNPAAVGEGEVRRWQAEGLAEYVGPTDAAEELYAQADCVVLPSYREGMPRVLLEAAASALPVIATDVPGCNDAVIDGKTGFLCQSRDAASLAAAMRRMMLLSPSERAAMGGAGRERMEREFSEEVVFAAYRAALSGSVENGSAAPFA